MSEKVENLISELGKLHLNEEQKIIIITMILLSHLIEIGKIDSKYDFYEGDVTKDSVLKKIKTYYEETSKKTLYIEETFFYDSDFTKVVNLLKNFKLGSIEELQEISLLFYRSRFEMFLLPKEIIQLISKITSLENPASVYYTSMYDLSLFLELYKELKDSEIKIENENKFVLNNLLSKYTKDRLIFGESNYLKEPSFKKGLFLEKFPVSILNPPLSRIPRVFVEELNREDLYNRFVDLESNSDSVTISIKHCMSQTSGKLVILLPSIYIYKQKGSESRFKKYLIDKNLVDTVIKLSFEKQRIGHYLLILNLDKKDEEVFFIDAKGDLDKVLRIYEAREEIDKVSKIVNKEDLSVDLSVDNYLQKLQKKMVNIELVKLSDIAETYRGQAFKDSESGDNYKEIYISDLPKCAYIEQASKDRKIEGDISRYKLEGLDILLSVKGSIGKVGILPEVLEGNWLANQAFQVIRLKDKNKKEATVALYMFFKSKVGQELLKSKEVSSIIPQISASSIRELEVPKLEDYQAKRIYEKFEEESKKFQDIEKLYKEIEEINSNYLEYLSNPY